ncbi:ABC transporter substrate-binding protein [Geomonas limicola]|uniref:ABC transporter substrate-binding protein n=1 Tax=Geomonas limicola TaxID=2740186 RepID=A0A6V8NFK7_9BACT|nr:ABC transporter substrate-binding protein [Geomonas limicola]
MTLCVTVSGALASEILVVQSLRSPLYDEALRGLKESLPARSRTLVLSDYADPDLPRVVREERPRLIVAIGDTALSALRKVRGTPVVSLMALGLGNHSGLAAGVGLAVKPEQYLAVAKKLRAHRIGIVYDPSRNEWYLKLARQAARQHGVDLVTREVHDPRQTLAQLESLKGKVDALWLLPDPTAVTGETLEAYFLFSQSQAVPVLSFSAMHLKLGALVALEVDRFDLGRQTGEMAQQLLQGVVPDPALAAPRRVTLKVNDAVARRLNYPTELIQSLTRK